MQFKAVLKTIALLIVYNVIALYQSFFLKVLTNKLGFNIPFFINLISNSGMFTIATLVLYFRDRKQKTGLNVIARIKQNMKNLKKTIPISILFMTNAICATYGLQETSLPIYLAIRRCQVTFVIIMCIMLCHFNKVKFSMVVAAVLITSSTMFAALGDLAHGTVKGYLFLVASNMGMVMYSELSKYLQKDHKIEGTELLQQNCFNSIFIGIILNSINGDFINAHNYFQKQSSTKILLIVGSFLVFVVFNFIRQTVHLMCTKSISVFAISLSVNVKDIVGTLVSLIFFDDVTLSVQVVVSLLCSFVAAFGYAIIKYYEDSRQNKKCQVEQQQSQEEEEEQMKDNTQIYINDRENLKEGLLKNQIN